jgi:hypothetical protein
VTSPLIFGHSHSEYQQFSSCLDSQIMELTPTSAAFSTVKPLQIGGQTFTSITTLIRQMELLRETMPAEVYEQYLDEGAKWLSEWRASKHGEVDDVCAQYYQYAEKTRRDWGQFEQSTRCKGLGH